MADILLPNYHKNLLDILNDEEYYDITVEVGNDPYIKIFRAHMVYITLSFLPYLRRILSTNKRKMMELYYIYGGNISLNEYDNSDIIKILIAAKELSLQDLITYLQSFLIENETNWIEQNF
ncbi:unnamed protein product [Rhizophagus irregularis]|nr:unnamed protein product [Rhizophagus irregularis]